MAKNYIPAKSVIISIPRKMALTVNAGQSSPMPDLIPEKLDCLLAEHLPEDESPTQSLPLAVEKQHVWPCPQLLRSCLQQF